jgi:hypothetical protein
LFQNRLHGIWINAFDADGPQQAHQPGAVYDLGLLDAALKKSADDLLLLSQVHIVDVAPPSRYFYGTAGADAVDYIQQRLIEHVVARRVRAHRTPGIVEAVSRSLDKSAI